MDISSKIEIRMAIADRILKDTNDLKDGTDETRSIAEDAIDLLSLTLNKPQNVNSTLAEMALDVLANLWVIEESMKELLAKEAIREEYASVLGYLIVYADYDDQQEIAVNILGHKELFLTMLCRLVRTDEEQEVI